MRSVVLLQDRSSVWGKRFGFEDEKASFEMK